MHDLVGVTGSAVLGGQLTLNLINGFMPEPNTSISVFNAAGGLFGVFANVASGQRLTTLDGLGSFLVHYGPSSPFNSNQVVLADFQPTFTADFDHDGDVDGDDLSQWGDDFGVNDFSDADSDGDSDGNDFLLWQQQLGGGSMATASVAAVPEPTGAVLLLLASIAAISQSRPLKAFLV